MDVVLKMLEEIQQLQTQQIHINTELIQQDKPKKGNRRVAQITGSITESCKRDPETV